MRLSVKTRLPVVAAGLAALCLAGPARAVDADKYTPADADVVVSVNVRRLIDSPVFQKYGKADALQNLQTPPVPALLAALGLDPLKDVDSLLLTSAGDILGANPKVLFVARGKFDVMRIGAAAAVFAKANPAALKVNQVNGLTIYEGAQGGQTVYAHLLANGTALLASTDKDYLIQAVQTPSPGPSKAMQDALSKVPGDDAVWVAVVVTDAMKKRLTNTAARRLAPKLEVVTASVSVTTEVETRLAVYTKDAVGVNDAKGLLDEGKDYLGLYAEGAGPFSPLLQNVHDNVEITTDKDKNAVKVIVHLTENLLKTADELKKSGAVDKPDK